MADLELKINEGDKFIECEYFWCAFKCWYASNLIYIQRLKFKPETFKCHPF
jgi:hypothetical protein